MTSSAAGVRPFSTWLSWSGFLLAAFVAFDMVLLAMIQPGADWSPLWTAGGLAWTDPVAAYDFALLTAMQLPLFDLGTRPFVYPPTALLLLGPAALLPFWLTLLILSLGSVLGLAGLASKRETDRLLLLLSPPVLLVALAGQPSALVACMLFGGLANFRNRPLLGGALLGAAAVLKPTLLLLAPVGLLAAREWRALFFAAAAGAAMIGASLLLFGMQTWLAWFEALPRFRELFETSEPLYRNGITPQALAIRLDLDAAWLPLLLTPAALVLTVLVFRLSTDWRARGAAVVSGSLLVSPYAMNYELAVLAPFVLTLPRERWTDIVLPLVWGLSLFWNASLLGLVAVILMLVHRTLRMRSADQSRMGIGSDVRAGQQDHAARTVC